MENAIVLQSVTKTFGAQRAVDQLDLKVPAGSIYGFIGPNGSGKTTTLRMILRIFQPDSGRVEVLGQTQGTTADDRLGYLPEERGLYKRMKVRELLTYYARLKGFHDCRAAIDQWLERLGGTTWVNKRIDALSKGMAQKIQFIAAVISRPQLVILDEPFSGLDPVNMETLKDAVMSLRSNGTTVIFSTHDMEMAERMCDTIFMIFKGKKVLDGSLDEIQAKYPANRIRVRFADPSDKVPDIKGITDLQTVGRHFEFQCDDIRHSQQILRQLVEQRTVIDYRVVKPSLHDIFVQIARPELDRSNTIGAGVNE